VRDALTESALAFITILHTDLYADVNLQNITDRFLPYYKTCPLKQI